MSEARDIPADERESAGASPANRSTGAGKRIGTYLAIALVIFLAGFVPMWLKARTAGNERDEATRELRLARAQNALSAAALDARRGDYEPARQSASDFFTSLSANVDDTADAALTTERREAIRPLLAKRDEIITLLARSDPASADRLSDIYVAYRKAMSSAPAPDAAK
jgi:hypothetical protein